MATTIRVQCTACGAQCQAPEKLAGKQVKCPKCSTAIVVSRRPEQTSVPDAAAKKQTPTVLTCDCGKRLRVKAELAEKRVKCPACGKPLAVPGPRSGAQPVGTLDMDLLMGAAADAEAMPGGPLQPLRKKKQPSNTRLIVGLSVGAGAVVLAVLLFVLMRPTGNDKELAKEEPVPNEQSQAAVATPNDKELAEERPLPDVQPQPAVAIPAELNKKYPWLAGSAPFDVAEFLEPIPEAENAAPLYLKAFAEFDLDVLYLLVADEEKLNSILQQRRPVQKRRDDQYMRFDEAWRKDPKSVDLAEVNTWLAECESGFEKLAEAQKRPLCLFEIGLDVYSASGHAMGARQVARAMKWRIRRDLARDDIEQAFEGTQTILRLGRDLRPRGDWTCQLTSVAVDEICYRECVTEILFAPKIEPHHCDRLIAILSQHEQSRDMYLEALLRDYLAVRKILEQLKRSPEEIDSAVANELGEALWRDKARPRDREERARQVQQYLATVNVQREREALDQWYRSATARSEGTLREREQQLKALAEDTKKKFKLAIPKLLPHLAPVSMAFARHEAFHRGTKCLIALRRWQLEENTAPRDLAEVVRAAGMDEVPTDPFSGEPLQMTDIDGEPVIYSIGMDGNDDRGRVDVWNSSQRGKGDLLFRVRANP